MPFLGGPATAWFSTPAITGIDPPNDVEPALAAINTAHNHVSRRSAWPRLRLTSESCSRSVPEIETLRAQAEVEP